MRTIPNTRACACASCSRPRLASYDDKLILTELLNLIDTSLILLSSLRAPAQAVLPPVYVRRQGVGFWRSRGRLFPGERSEPVIFGAAGENFADFKAEMAYFMAKWGTNVVYGENQSCQES